MDLNEKVVLITGAKGGLGSFVTTAFLEAGAWVIGVSRSIANSDFPNERFSALPGELSGRESAAKMIHAATERWGRIDALVHLVGGFSGGTPVPETGDDVVDRMFDVNFRSAFQLIRAVLPFMRQHGGGRILAIGSKAAVEPAPMAAAYAASKAALVSLIRTVARENSDRGITANVVLPGTMDTPANRASDSTADFSKWVNPCQVASLLLHLASGRASNINGAVIPVYGTEA
jgi:NAD(P)-dependent dehydrogenase (short-subunit alcohol dehydrogenase family)